MKYSPLIPFYTNSISVSFKRSNFTLVFIKAACYASLGEIRKKKQGLVHTFQNSVFESSEMHHLTIKYRFEHFNGGILLNCLFENLYKLPVHVICISNIFHV